MSQPPRSGTLAQGNDSDTEGEEDDVRGHGATEDPRRPARRIQGPGRRDDAADEGEGHQDPPLRLVPERRRNRVRSPGGLRRRRRPARARTPRRGGARQALPRLRLRPRDDALRRAVTRARGADRAAVRDRSIQALLTAPGARGRHRRRCTVSRIDVQPAPIAESAPASAGWTGGRVAALGIGVVLVLVSLALLGGAGTGVWLEATQRDGGYVTTGTHAFSTGGAALVTRSTRLGSAGWGRL